MRINKFSILAFIFATLIIFNSPNSIKAVELITNGGFENATAFSGWTTQNSPSPWRPLQNTVAGGGGGFTSVGITTVAPSGGTKNAWNGQTDNVTSNSQWQFYQNVTIPAGVATTVRWHDRYQMNHTQFCPGGTCQPKRYFVEITNAAGTTVLQVLHQQDTIGNVNQDTGWVLRSRTLGPDFSGQTVRLRFRGTETVPLTGPGQVEIDNVSMNTFVPTAANASISGKVTNEFGRGAARVGVTLTTLGTGTRVTTTTNMFGYYQFQDLPSGELYMVSVDENKRYVFDNPSQTVQLNESLESVNFVGRSRWQ
ncbi:MAG: carboxypeptidase regulatory-like domain-containing protein [Pyrinomonadaceae bacterium]|jgi:hypothetical protein|nr:carboxypeptidase regulatory-like domain-containing protein [Pyrinomonadaceae bacterium]